jgi:hypothetical protein
MNNPNAATGRMNMTSSNPVLNTIPPINIRNITTITITMAGEFL